MIELSVVVPVRDEAGNVAPLVSELARALDGAVAYEIVFVDDGSADGSATEIKALCSEASMVRLLRHRTGCGKSAALRSGIRAAKGDWIATIDGDGQQDPADLLRLWDVARRAACEPPLLVAGFRRSHAHGLLKRIASRCANTLKRPLLGDRTPDSGCGLKLIRREHFLDLPHFDNMHRFLAALVQRAGGTVTSVPVADRPRTRGRSKYGISNRLGHTLVDLMGVAWLMRRAHYSVVEEERLGKTALVLEATE